MREIKFRATNAHTKKWNYGHYVNHDNYPQIWVLDKNGRGVFPTPVDPETVGQFTGLTDKNGKEIYEGDVLKGGMHKVYEVKWDGQGWNIHPDNMMYFEVIGTIHDK